MYNLKTRIRRAILFFIILMVLGAILLSATACCAPLTDLFMGQGPAEGEAAPDFTLTSLQGEEVTLSALQGQAVLIMFWSST